jgi:hypothetical protein
MCFDPKESLSKEFEMTIKGKLLIALVSKLDGIANLKKISIPRKIFK